MKNTIDKKLFEIMQNDRIGNPDTKVEDRLMYTFMLKNGTSNIRQNSFAGFTGWLFSFKNMGAKTVALSCLLFISLMNTKLQHNTGNTGNCDSTFVEKALVLDTTRFSTEINTSKGDTLF